MEFYDTSLQDAIEQYTRSHELIETPNTSSSIIPYTHQNVLQSSVKIVPNNQNFPNQPQQQSSSVGVLMHTSNCTTLQNISLKKPNILQFDLKSETNEEKSLKNVTAVPKKRKVPNDNKKTKKRKILKKKGKSKRPYANNPQRYMNKVQREMGLEYQGHVKVNDKWEKIGKESKKLKPRCNCKYSKSKSTTKIQCGSVTDEEREHIFNAFWKLTWKEKRLYVRLMVNIKPVANRTLKKDSRRLKTLEIHLKCEDRFVRVCKKMFLQTLCLSEWALKDWIRVGESKVCAEGNRTEVNIDDQSVQSEKNDNLLNVTNLKNETRL